MPPPGQRVGSAEHRPAVALEELLDRVRLNPGQAAVLALDILDEFGVCRSARHDGPCAPVVRVGVRTGDVEHDLTTARARLQAVLAQLQPPTDAPPGRDRKVLTALASLDRLLDCVARGRVGLDSVSAAVRSLEAELGPAGRRMQTRRELAALAATVALPPTAQRHDHLPARPAAPGVEPPPGLRRRAARVVVLLAVLAVLVGLGRFATGLIAAEIAPPPHVLAAGAGPVRPDRTPAAHASLPVLGPPAAGAIRQVELRTVGVCRPGAQCLVRVLVTLTRPGVTREVDWQVFVVNRCGGRRTPTAAGSITVPAASDHGSVLTQVPVPEGVQALVAVTTDPAHAAAKALPLPGTGSAC